MKFVLASALLVLLAAPAAEPKSAESQCSGRCSVDYSFCLKRTTTAKGRQECKFARKICKKSCSTKLPKPS